MTRRWSPSPLLYATAAVHAGAAAATLIRPSLWPWMLGAVAANHAVLAAAGLVPRSRLLGPNLLRLPRDGNAPGRIAITIDDGPDPEVTPRVLEVLAARRARATFFCIGARVERHPELAREIVRGGHAIENHSQRHRHDFSLMGPARMSLEIEGAQATIARITGRTPSFFRAPAGLRNPFLDPILARLGLRLASWTRRGFDTVTASPDLVYQRLARSLESGDILLLHDGHAARAASGAPVVVEVLPRLLETAAARGLETVTLAAALGTVTSGAAL
ncbi:MAG TPA: polysaccharide deacetylase family protein [Steroidobacteraceae bacterium]|jgi:peptidoglycan/xylan/chitin deacetylase (PgdA/CDA1 family)|nr:polysaccharide deacetylase family protein [Steroidobacteraceae bacterium]